MRTASFCQHHHIFDNVFLAFDVEIENQSQCLNEACKYFSIDEVFPYVGFADDFGPMSMASVYQFYHILDAHLEQSVGDNVALMTRRDRPTLTNSVFLLGTYMIMKLDYDVARTAACFQGLMHMTVSYRDVSPGAQNFQLHLQDCWAGLLRGKQLGWADFSAHASQRDSEQDTGPYYRVTH